MQENRKRAQTYLWVVREVIERKQRKSLESEKRRIELFIEFEATKYGFEVCWNLALKS